MDANEQFQKALEQAYDIGAGMMVSSSQSSRAHSIAMTHLETAQLWTQRDAEEKARTGEIPKEVE